MALAMALAMALGMAWAMVMDFMALDMAMVNMA
jgi:hypothetical protein